MTENPLAWLTVGATVAYVVSGSTTTVTEAIVEKVGKRDIVVTVRGRTTKFNINYTIVLEDVTWLRQRGSESWGLSTDLGPLDCPRVERIRVARVREDAIGKVWGLCKDFQRRRDVESARELRAAVDAFLGLEG